MRYLQRTMPTAGFTLIELMVTLAVLAILVTLAAPAFSGFIADQRTRTGAQALFTALNYARSEAIRQNANVVVRATGQDEWNQGWIVSTNTNRTVQECLDNNTLEGCLRINQPNSGLDIEGPASVTFTREGRATTNASFRVCDAEGSAAVSRRVVRLDLSGRANIDRDGDCST